MKIGIIGNGFVGSALVHGFMLSVEDILINDSDAKKSTHSFEDVVTNSQIVFVCVPTPMYESGDIDVSIVENVIRKISDMECGHDPVIVVKSTVVPGTMENLSKKFSKVKLVFNPEFLTERRARLDFINASRIVLGGENEEAVSRVESLYRKRFSATPILKTNFATAQLIKYVSNCFFATKVSFMNEMKQVCDAVGADWQQTVDGFILDGRVGNSHLEVPGHDGDFGFGGKCFPKDINAMIKMCEQAGVNPLLLKAAWQKNLEVRKNLNWYDIPGAVTKEEK